MIHEAITWTAIPGPAILGVLDAASKLFAQRERVVKAIRKAPYYIYNTASNILQFGGSCQDMNESCWVRLPNDNVLGMTDYSTNSEHYVPSLNAWYGDGDSPVALFGYGAELGANFVLPNGTVFQIGGSTNTAIYTPGSNLTSAGSWVAGPAMVFGTNQLGAVDAPAAMLDNGNVLLCIGPIGGFNSPCFFYEYNYLSNNFTQVGAPAAAAPTAVLHSEPLLRCVCRMGRYYSLAGRIPAHCKCTRPAEPPCRQVNPQSIASRKIQMARII